MNLLCPNCQKMLTVPEQYAGQLMKCPLCSGNFTVPALPDGAAAAVPAPVPAAPTPQPAPAQTAAEVYTLSAEDHPPPAPAWSPHVTPAPAPPPAPLPALSPPPSTSAAVTPTPPPAPSTTLPEGYHRSCTVRFSPKVLPWIAPVCLLLVFVLQFFPWIGIYPGGVPMIWENAWSAAFPGGSTDPDLEDTILVGNALNREKPKENPFAGVSILAIFYLLLFVLLALPLTVASVVVDRIPKLPPGVQRALPWRWGLVAAFNLVVFLFLGLQLALGFSLESRFGEYVEKNMAQSGAKTHQEKVAAATRGMAYDTLHYTYAMRLAVLLHLIALVTSALMFWVDRRGTNRPLPRLELQW